MIFLNYSCNTNSPQINTTLNTLSEAKERHVLEPYWFDGNAEVNTYELEQVRYGAHRKGKAVAIFVTEPFIRSRQVKADHYDPKNTDHTVVLKLNLVREFQTGIYPYRLFSSVFTDLGESASPHALKAVSSIYEWCGVAFTQLNQQDNHFALHAYSYFESEGDRQDRLPIQFLEDELFNLIRINPELLPIGDTNMIPGLSYCRLKHQAIQSVKSDCSKSNVNDTVAEYHIEQAAFQRSIRIQYLIKPPHDILSWEESYPEEGVIMSSTAKRTHKEKLQYWNLHSVSDSLYLQKIGL